MADLYTAADVFAALRIPYKTSGKNIHVPCPICGSRHAFVMQMERSTGYCFECYVGLNQISYYAKTRGITTKEANEEMMAYKNLSTSSGKEQSQSRQTQFFAKESAIKSIKERNEVYSLFPAVFKLKEKDIKNLMKRGLTREEVLSLGYLSFGEDDWQRPVRLLYAEAVKQGKKINFAGIPGFFKNKENNNWELRKLKSGIMMPFRNVHNQVQGWQIRKDDALLRTYYKNGKEKKENKCNWLSSSDLNEGCPSGSYIHYATDFVTNFPSGETLPVIPNGVLNLTEGAMKGDIIHILSGKPVACMAGVSNHAALKRELVVWKKLGVKLIRDICDMDYFTNPSVREFCNKNRELILAAGIGYRRVLWNTKIPGSDKVLKGRDDYLMYHQRGVIPN